MITRVYKESILSPSHCQGEPSQYQYVTGTTVMIPIGRFFAILIIDVDYIIDDMHSPVYQSNIGLYLYRMAQ